jgi:hypothetical protein
LPREMEERRDGERENGDLEHGGIPTLARVIAELGSAAGIAGTWFTTLGAAAAGRRSSSVSATHVAVHIVGTGIRLGAGWVKTRVRGLAVFVGQGVLPAVLRVENCKSLSVVAWF